MDAVVHISETRSNRIIDMLCTLMIGVGLGGLCVYWYATSHMRAITISQPTQNRVQKDAGNTKTGEPEHVDAPLGPKSEQI